MTPTYISNLRLQNQQLSSVNTESIRNVVSRMGAMQAQDYTMARWAVGIRLPESTEMMIGESFRKGEILRTHVMRPTWHFVSPDDIFWMIELTGPRLKKSLLPRFNRLGLTPDIITNCQRIIVEALERKNYLTRDELMLCLQNEHISMEDLPAAHIMMICELDGLVCSGPLKGKKQTYALLEERAIKPASIPRDEALSKLAFRYFSSHGPATIQDFIWWSGLTSRDAANALQMVKTEFVSFELDGQIYWLKESVLESERTDQSAFLIPAYDEFIISYRDRSAALHSENNKKAISDNGLFRPVIVIGGKVAGIWKRISKKDLSVIECSYFFNVDKSDLELVENAADHYSRFIGQKIEIVNRFA